MLAQLPIFAKALPEAMLNGIRKASFDAPAGWPFFIAAALVLWLGLSGRKPFAVVAVALSVVFGAAYFKGTAFPELDRRVSVRGFWLTHRNELDGVCTEGLRRDWEYGLNYYAGRAIPVCEAGSTSKKIVVEDARMVLK
jgi:hypothetical protein